MKDLIFSISIILAAVVIYLLTLMFPPDLAQEGGVGPGFFPKVVAILMAGLGLILLLTAVRRKRLERSEPSTTQPEEAGGRPIRRTAVAFIIIVCYAVGIYYIGFVVGTLVFLLVAISFYLSNFGPRRFFTFVLPISILVTAITYVVFRIAIRIPLPRGVLF
jgi:putative tricarboxylic transport membrane protein